MVRHEDIWKGIDRLAESNGFSPSGLAKKAGLDPTSFNKSKRFSPEGKPRWPTTESIAKILAVTGATFTDFVTLTDMDKGAYQTLMRGRRVPVMGLAQAARDGHFDAEGRPKGAGWDDMNFPDAAHAGNLYALRIGGAALEPLVRPGGVLVLSPDAEIKRGDRVAVKTRKGDILVAEILKSGPPKTELRVLSAPGALLSLGPRDVAWMARVMWISQ